MNRTTLRRILFGAGGFGVAVFASAALLLSEAPRLLQMQQHLGDLERFLDQSFPVGDDSQKLGRWSLGELDVQIRRGWVLSVGPVQWTSPDGVTALTAKEVEVHLPWDSAWQLAETLWVRRWTGNWKKPDQPYEMTLSSHGIEGHFSNGLRWAGPIQLELQLNLTAGVVTGGSSAAELSAVQGKFNWVANDLALHREGRFEKPAGIPLQVSGTFDWSPEVFRLTDGRVRLDRSEIQFEGANTQFLVDPHSVTDSTNPPTPARVVRDWRLEAQGTALRPWIQRFDRTKRLPWDGELTAQLQWQGVAHQEQWSGRVDTQLRHVLSPIASSASVGGASEAPESWGGQLSVSWNADELEHFRFAGESDLGGKTLIEGNVQRVGGTPSSRRVDAQWTGEKLSVQRVRQAFQSWACDSPQVCLQSKWAQTWSGAILWDLKNVEWKGEVLDQVSGKLAFQPGSIQIPQLKGNFAQGGFDAVLGLQLKGEQVLHRYAVDLTEFPMALLTSSAQPQGGVDPASVSPPRISLKLEGTGAGWGWPETLAEWNAKGRVVLMNVPQVTALGMERLESRFTLTQGRFHATEFAMEGQRNSDQRLRLNAAGTIELTQPNQLQMRGELLELKGKATQKRTWVNVGCDWKAPCITARVDSKYESKSSGSNSKKSNRKSL